MLNRRKCCIIGIPDHQAVIHVGGRIGASRGPSAFRKIFSKLKGKNIMHNVIDDLGNVLGFGTDIAQNHRLAADLIREGHSSAGVSVIVGGSHDHGFSHLLGVSESLNHTKSQLKSKKTARTNAARKKIGCINIDAHLDVRKPAPWITSGSPFYLAIHSQILDPKHFIEFGIQSHCNSNELWNFVETKKIHVVPFEKLRHGKAVSEFKKCVKRLQKSCDSVVVSLDLDAASSNFAPGVSAPQSEGFTASELIEMVEWAGTQRKIQSLGIFELNPEHDIDDRTARLAATLAYHFIERKFF